MTYAGYKPNETASLGAITATGIDAITKINLEREKLDAARQVKKDALAAKAAQDKEKQAAKEAAEQEKEKKSAKEKISKNEGKTPFTINLNQNIAEVAGNAIDADPASMGTLMNQTNAIYALNTNRDAQTTALAANKNPSKQSSWIYEQTIGGFEKQKVSTFIVGSGKDAKIMFKNEKGETVSPDGVASIMNNVTKEMPNIELLYDKGYEQVGVQQQEVGRASIINVGAQDNYGTRVKEFKNMLLSDKDNLGDVFYSIVQKGEDKKTPIYYKEGDDKKELAVKNGVIESKAEFIELATNSDGKTYAKLTGDQIKRLEKDVDESFAVRVEKSKHTRPEGGSNITIKQQIGEAKTKETGEYYDKVIKGGNPTEAQFIRRAQAAGNMLAGITYPYRDPITKIVKDTKVYQNNGKGTIKILYEDKDGNVVQYRSTPKMSRAELIRDLEGFFDVSNVNRGSEAIATTQAVTGN